MAGRSEEINYDEAYISGFEIQQSFTSHDQMNRPNSAWADIYRHPTLQSTRNREEIDASRRPYEMFLDWYSLGIVLLKIAYWRPIDKTLSINLETACPEQTQAVKKRLLEEEPRHLSWVRNSLDGTIEEIIRWCLAGPEATGKCDKKGDSHRRHRTLRLATWS